MRISSNQIFNSGVNAILENQAALIKTQNQISSGKRVTVASDDPVAVSTIFNLEQQIGLSNRWIANAKNAESFAQQEEVVFFAVENNLQRVRELLIQSGNGTLNLSDREAIGTELTQRLAELKDLANTKINGNEYLFAGFKSDVVPVSVTSTGVYQYDGDQGQRQVDIGPGISVATSDSGYDTFFDIKNGNKTFLTRAVATNTGSGTISSGSVFDKAAFVADSYQIDFSITAAGQIQYEVFDSTATSIQGPLDFTSGDAIQFNGISFEIKGTPDAGDSFTVTPSSRQDIFTTIKNAISGIEQSTVTAAESAQLTNILTESISNLDNAMDKINRVHSRVGARLNIIDSQLQINQDFKLSSETTLSKVRDVDLVEAISRLNQQQLSLEAAQSSFARIQNLSLFNFLR
ncbi:MAG TPA: flagellar hook-associated protein 3 [Aeromonadales bacterium]|nr:flagellar hook-associated protein 3 [Aeromonadales bacterium]